MLTLTIVCLALLNLALLAFRIVDRWNPIAQLVAVIVPFAALVLGFLQYTRDKNEAQRLFELSRYAEESLARAALANTAAISHGLITGCMATSVVILGVSAWRERRAASIACFFLLLLLLLAWVWLQFQEWPTRIG